ncbi:MAG: UPF0182 family protein, partial [Bacillota bacterium]|nr:UPF0182 family protein [Bacillota bacterium]
SSKDHKRMRLVGIVLSIVLGAFLSYLVIYDLWFEILQYINSTDFGITDPLFGSDISFYMFKYDFLSGLASSAMIIIIGILFVVLVYYTVLVIFAKKSDDSFQDASEFEQAQADAEFETNDAPRREFNPNDPIGSVFDFVQDKMNGKANSRVKSSGSIMTKIKAVLGLILGQITVLVVLFFLAMAAKFVFTQYGLLYGGEGVAYGAGFTDCTVRLNVYRILIVLSVVAAIMIVVAAKKKSIKFAVIVPAAMVVVAVLGTGASMLVQNLIVEPNELSKESKYINNNIEYTRLAYNLADIKAYDFEPTADLDKVDVLNNMETFSNIRINDFAPTEQFYNQTQSIRSYYNFNDVDVDRYFVNNEYTQCFLSAREVDETRVEDSWLIQHLKYTHGYGLTLSRVDKVTSSGQPDMLIQSIPPVSEVPEIQIERPEIYYGEKTNNYVIVNTKETEFDYPSGESNVYCNYEGEGGIPLNFINRLLFAVREHSFKLLVSTNINSDSRIMIYRNIMDRVRKIAPFLTFDTDPYVVTVDGHIYWIIDAYTMSDKYPYSEPYYSSSNINYIRNSVKVIVDAYSGETNFYICDDTDPVVLTYAKIYPALFKSLDQMPEAFKSHLQYPNALFNIQAAVYEKYHMTDVGTFYQNEDLWAIAHDIYGQTESTMTANFFIMKLPGEESAEFVSTIAYTPAGKSNLTGLLTARSDGENYGQIVLYRMPKDRIIYGPAQIEAQINQDADISKEFALWNNSGSTYSRGDMFVIPVENSLLYVEPVYLEASTSSLPEVKRVIVYYNEQLAYASTLSEALDELFGAGAGDPLKTSYPIITGKEMAAAIEAGVVTPAEDNPTVVQPVDPTQEVTQPELTDKEAISNLIKEITDKLNELQKYLTE